MQMIIGPGIDGMKTRTIINQSRAPGKPGDHPVGGCVAVQSVLEWAFTNGPAMELTERVLRLEERLDNVLPTLVTKADLNDARADLHQALHAQTWKLIGAALVAAGLIVASLKLLH
jgi:hypothetical protein